MNKDNKFNITPIAAPTPIGEMSTFGGLGSNPSEKMN